MGRELNFSPFSALPPGFAIRVELQEGRSSPVFLLRWKEVRFFFSPPFPGPGAAAGLRCSSLPSNAAGEIGARRAALEPGGELIFLQLLTVPFPRKGFYPAGEMGAGLESV